MEYIQRLPVNTAGAYVIIDDLFLFAIGNKPHDGYTPIFRLGGHCEPGETAWQCAAREVFEESSIRIEPLQPETTFFFEWNYLEKEPTKLKWQTDGNEPAPILAISYQKEEKTSLSLMYFAQTQGVPKPSSEVKGLLLLNEEEIHTICQRQITLEQYLDNGGKAMLNGNFDTKLILEPFAQLRILSKLLDTISGLKISK